MHDLHRISKDTASVLLQTKPEIVRVFRPNQDQQYNRDDGADSC